MSLYYIYMVSAKINIVVPFIFSWYCTGPSQIKQAEVRKVEMNHSFKTIVYCMELFI